MVDGGVYFVAMVMGSGPRGLFVGSWQFSESLLALLDFVLSLYCCACPAGICCWKLEISLSLVMAQWASLLTQLVLCSLLRSDSDPHLLTGLGCRQPQGHFAPV